MPDENEPTMGHVTVADPIPSPEPARMQSVVDVLAAPALPIRRAVEEWAARKSIAPWLLKAAAVGERWQMGPEFEPVMATEAEFDHAIAFAENPHAIANPPKPNKQ